MTAPIDYTWKLDSEHLRRDDAAHAVSIADARSRIDAALARRTQPIEENSMFVRIDWKLKLKEKLWPRSYRKRVAKEAALAHAVPEQPDHTVQQPEEPASLPGAGLQKLKEQDDEPLPPSPVDETDPNMTRGDYDDQISALPPMPGHQRQASAASSEDFDLPDDQQRNEEPSLEDLMDATLEAADAPGNHCSVRSSLPPEWRATEFSRMMISDPLSAQQETGRSTEHLPLPSAVFAAGPGHLPALSSSRSVPNFAVTGSRPGTARVGAEDGEEGTQATPAAGRWFRSVRGNQTLYTFGSRRPRRMEGGD